MKNSIVRSLALLALVFTFSVSCNKNKDDEIFGCVYGKVPGIAAEYQIGCMSKSQFNRYLENPSFTINGVLVNKDLRFAKVIDCLECN
jgi:hypothetical protein